VSGFFTTLKIGSDSVVARVSATFSNLKAYKCQITLHVQTWFGITVSEYYMQY